MEGDEPVVLRRDDRLGTPNPAKDAHRSPWQWIARRKVEQLSDAQLAGACKPTGDRRSCPRATDEGEAEPKQQDAAQGQPSGEHQ